MWRVLGSGTHVAGSWFPLILTSVLQLRLEAAERRLCRYLGNSTDTKVTGFGSLVSTAPAGIALSTILVLSGNSVIKIQ